MPHLPTQATLSAMKKIDYDLHAPPYRKQLDIARFITEPKQLEHYIDTLLHSSEIEWIAIDTEFVRRDTYYPELSLIQICDALGNLALIDPICIEQASGRQALLPIKQLMEAEHIRKVFHSARQDIEVLFTIEQCLPKNVFDTQIAALFLGHGDLAGFGRVIKAELHIALEKSQTCTNWHARPLSNKQLQYALDDVFYLAPLYQHLLRHLNSEQIQAVMDETAQILKPEIYAINPQDAWHKVKGLKALKPKQLAIVQALAAWREDYAITHNKPKKWTLSDDVIVAIAKRPPKVKEALYKVPSIKSSSVKEFGSEWITLIDQVFERPSQSYPQVEAKPAKASEEEEILFSLLNGYALQIAQTYGINWTNLTHRDELLQFIRHPNETRRPGWREYLFFQPARLILAGQTGLMIQNNKLTLVTNPTRL